MVKYLQLQQIIKLHRLNADGVLLLSHDKRSFFGEAPAKLERKVAAAERSMEALKNHGLAEKRRRARINALFYTLCGLIRGANNMDKASLLGEVINSLKDLRRKTKEAIEQHSVVPKLDIDEVKVEQDHDDQFSQGTPNN